MATTTASKARKATDFAPNAKRKATGAFAAAAASSSSTDAPPQGGAPVFKKGKFQPKADVYRPADVNHSIADLMSIDEYLKFVKAGAKMVYIGTSGDNEKAPEQIAKSFHIRTPETKTYTGLQVWRKDQQGVEFKDPSFYNYSVHMDLTPEQYEFFSVTLFNRIVEAMIAKPDDFFGPTEVKKLKQCKNDDERRTAIRMSYKSYMNDVTIKEADDDHPEPRKYEANMKLKVNSESVIGGLPQLQIFHYNPKTETMEPKYSHPAKLAPWDINEENQAQYDAELEKLLAKWGSAEQREKLFALAPAYSIYDFDWDFLGISVNGMAWQYSNRLLKLSLIKRSSDKKAPQPLKFGMPEAYKRQMPACMVGQEIREPEPVDDQQQEEQEQGVNEQQEQEQQDEEGVQQEEPA